MDNKMAVLVKTLEKDIQQYDRILLFETPEYLKEFYHSKTAQAVRGKLLILCQKLIFTEFKKYQISSYNASAIKEVFMGNIVFRQITEKEAGLLESLYFTYEFSDKFIFVTRERRSYPSLYHFVESGVLSREDIFQVLCGE